MLIRDIGAPYLEDDVDYCICPICGGTGHGPKPYEHEICPACKGDGEIEAYLLDYHLKCYTDWWVVDEDEFEEAV